VIAPSSGQNEYFAELPEKLLVELVTKQENTEDEKVVIDGIDACLGCDAWKENKSRKHSIASTTRIYSDYSTPPSVSYLKKYSKPIVSKQPLGKQKNSRSLASVQSAGQSRYHSGLPEKLLVEFVSKEENTEDEKVVIDGMESSFGCDPCKKMQSRSHSSAFTVETDSDFSPSSVSYSSSESSLENYSEPIISKQLQGKQRSFRLWASAQSSCQRRHYSQLAEKLLFEVVGEKDTKKDSTNGTETAEVYVSDMTYDETAITSNAWQDSCHPRQ